MKEILLLCTENVHFTFENNFYQQKYREIMGFPLCPALAVIFMVLLERDLIAKLSKYMNTLDKVR